MPGGWLSEGRRSYVAMAVGTLVAGGAGVVLDARGERLMGHLEVLVLLLLAGYLLAYVLGTALVFALTPADRYLPWAEASRRGSWYDHYVLASHRPWC